LEPHRLSVNSFPTTHSSSKASCDNNRD